VTQPSTGQTICTVPDSSQADVDAAISAAEAAQSGWGQTAGHRARQGPAGDCRQGYREHAEPLARLITEEQGKVLGLARARSPSPPTIWITWPNGRAASRERFSKAIAPAQTILLFRQPIGRDRRHPFRGTSRSFSSPASPPPALITGNTIVIKPSEETPHNAVKFCELVAETDLPPGVINIVPGAARQPARLWLGRRASAMISFTGTVETGSAIMAAAAPNITKVNLELGGKAPAIVMADADMALGRRSRQGFPRHQQRPGLATAPSACTSSAASPINLWTS